MAGVGVGKGRGEMERGRGEGKGRGEGERGRGEGGGELGGMDLLFFRQTPTPFLFSQTQKNAPETTIHHPKSPT